MEWVLDRNEVFMAHILAIDDDPGILALIEHALRREGHTITCMPHVPADLAAHLAEYDLILLDVMMPQTAMNSAAPSATTRTARFCS